MERLTFYCTSSFGKRYCEPGWYWDHQVPFDDYDIFYVLAGKGVMTLGGERFELQKNSCLVMRPGDLPKAAQDPDARLKVLYLHFRIRTDEPDWELRFPFPRFTLVGDAFPAESLLYRIMELLDVSPPLGTLEFDCLLKQFFIHLYRIQWTPPPQSAVSAKQAKNARLIASYIRESGGTGIDLAELARLLNMSPQYMSRLFKTCTGTTLRDFIARTKMEWAKDLLISTRMNISEVADQLGYSDVYAFSKSFKQVYGASPTRFLADIRLPKSAPPPAN